MLDNIKLKSNRELLGFREPTIGELDFINRHIDKFSILDNASCIRTILYIILAILLMRNLPENNMLLILFVIVISYFVVNAVISIRTIVLNHIRKNKLKNGIFNVLKVEPFATDAYGTYYRSERGEFIKYDMAIGMKDYYGNNHGLIVKIADKYINVWS